jgi:antitoxin (DNA-binding transcriptional repressor) of toxin-antitoxin stability system
MKRVNMHDAKTNLSRYIAELAPGETILLCNRNEPVAELRAISKFQNRAVKLGVAKGMIEIPDSFFDPLPDEILRAFNGEDD